MVALRRELGRLIIDIWPLAAIAIGLRQRTLRPLQHFEGNSRPRRGEGSVQLCQLVGRKPQVSRCPILADMRLRPGLGNGDDPVAGKQPGERDLRRRGAQVPGHRRQGRMIEQAALFDRL